MIYTLTLNPSLDLFLHVKDFEKGTISRSDDQITRAGGKGINVSIVLSHFGYESRVLGFAGGFTGQEIERQLKEKHISADFIEVEETSRINVKIRAQEETDINGPGPEITEDSMAELYTRLDQLKEGDVLVMSGSLPASLPLDTYAQILKRYRKKKIRIVADCAGEALKAALKYHPFLIKPNQEEVSELLNRNIHTRLQAMEGARKLRHMGAQNVLVSLGENGAVFIAKDGREYSSAAPEGECVNTTGAGDSMIAGFLAGYLEKEEYTRAFHYGLCAGSASAFGTGLAEKEATDRLYEEMKEKYGWIR